jgi:hypothetical protein
MKTLQLPAAPTPFLARSYSGRPTMNPFPAPPPPTLAPLATPLPSAGRELLCSITLQAPLLDMAAACLALRCAERRLMEWVFSGDLEWTFDLRRAGARRSCLRVLTESIVRFRQRNRALTSSERTAQRLHPFGKVFDPMFPHHRPFLLSTELTRVWTCSSSHIHNLVQDGHLCLVDKHYEAREAVQIRRETVFDFMQSRRII